MLQSIQKEFKVLSEQWKKMRYKNSEEAIKYLQKQNIDLKPLTDKFNNKSLSKLFSQSYFSLYQEDEVGQFYQMYDKFPSLIVVKGKIQVVYINFEGDLELLEKVEESNFFSLSKQELLKLHGQNGINLLTGFQILSKQNTLLLQFPANVINELERQKAQFIIRLVIREKQILKYYGIETNQYKLQLINQPIQIQRQKACFLLLRGTLCICKNGIMLAVYNEGFFNTQMNNELNTKFIIFSGSQLIYLDNFPMTLYKHLKHSQKRRSKHIEKLIVIYNSFGQREKLKIQQTFIKMHSIKINQLQKLFGQEILTLIRQQNLDGFRNSSINGLDKLQKFKIRRKRKKI